MELYPPGYKSIPQQNQQGGGVAIVYRNTLILTYNSTYNFQSMECSDFRLDLPSQCVNLVIIYRPPDRKLQQFLNDLYDYMENNIYTTGKLLLIGDFNIKINDETNHDTAKFIDFLERFGLVNHIHFGTHCQENTLDLVISSEQYHLVHNPTKGHLFSDHNFVYYNLLTNSKSQNNSKLVNYHKFKALVPIDFGANITGALTKVELHNLHLSSCLKLYNDLLINTIDKHALRKTKILSNRKKMPWFSDEVSNAIRSRRRAEHKWLLDKNNSDKFLEFYRSRCLTTNILNQGEKNYFCKPVHDNCTKTKKIFAICNNLLGRSQDLLLPPSFTDKELAKCFNKFFISKIANIRDSLTAKQVQLQSPPVLHQSIVPCMDSFRLLSDKEVAVIVRKSPTKTCEADQIPTTLFKDILPHIVPLLREIVNKSLQTGTFPDDLKVALVRPLLKKINLDLIEKNYRLVSNLQFIGKLIERAVNIQLNEHITTNNLMEPMQSAYRVGHSTETALIKVNADILNAINNKEVVCLVLLNLLAAFDIVNHQILLERLKNMFGLTGTVINWITSYFSGRLQKVVVVDANSSAVPLSCGVPQGSILGPILFTLYTTPLRKICNKHAVTYYLYADDQQLYLVFKPSLQGPKSNASNNYKGVLQISINGCLQICLNSMMKKLNL